MDDKRKIIRLYLMRIHFFKNLLLSNSFWSSLCWAKGRSHTFFVNEHSFMFTYLRTVSICFCILRKNCFKVCLMRSEVLGVKYFWFYRILVYVIYTAKLQYFVSVEFYCAYNFGALKYIMWRSKIFEFGRTRRSE